MNDPFTGLSKKDKKNLLTLLKAHIYTFDVNKDILSSIKNDNVIGIIETGSAKIIRTDYNGNESIIEHLELGSMFGTIISSLENNEFRIITNESTTIIIIDYNLFLKGENINYKNYNGFMQNILKIISQKLKQKNQRIRILTKKTIRNKLLEYFQIEQENHHSKIIYLPFSFTELADYLAIDRSAMTRELKFLKDEGFIEVKNRKIKILY